MIIKIDSMTLSPNKYNQIFDCKCVCIYVVVVSIFSFSLWVLQTISCADFVVWFTYFNHEIIYNESTDCNKLLSQASALSLSPSLSHAHTHTQTLYFLLFFHSLVHCVCVFFFGSYQLSRSNPIYRTDIVMYFGIIERELSSFCFILNIYYENFLKLLCFCSNSIQCRTFHTDTKMYAISFSLLTFHMSQFACYIAAFFA